MRITGVRITAPDLDEVAAFHSGVLGLPVVSGASAVEVGVGTSTLTVVPGPTGPGVHHLAFDVPEDRFADAKDWLGARVELSGLDRMDEFAGPGSWNSHSVYFAGPGGIVLELIARHALPNATGSTGAAVRPFDSADLLDISEMGVAVPDVPAAVADLGRTFGLREFGLGSEVFAPVGDHDGLLIVVARERVWFPTRDQRSGGGPVTVTIGGDIAGTWRAPGGDCVVTCPGPRRGRQPLS